MSDVTGDRRFNSRDVKIAKFDNTPPEPGIHELKLNGKKAEIKVSKESGNQYVNVSFTALGTGNGGPDKRVYVMFHLNTKKSEKDGHAMFERENGIFALAKAIPTEIDLDVVELESGEHLNPQQVVDFLKDNDGAVVKGFVRVKPASNGYEAKAEIGRWIEAEDTSELP